MGNKGYGREDSKGKPAPDAEPYRPENYGEIAQAPEHIMIKYHVAGGGKVQEAYADYNENEEAKKNFSHKSVSEKVKISEYRGSSTVTIMLITEGNHFYL
jgi:hypothetical protein